MKLILPLFICAWMLAVGEGKQCYQCVSDEGGDWRCLDNPAGVAAYAKDCPKKFCTIVRQEYANEKGRVKSFGRYCQKSVTFRDKVIKDADFITYIRSCTSNLCNKGDGLHTLSGSGDDDDITQIFIVPGYTSDVFGINPNEFLLVLSVFLASVIAFLQN